MIYFITGLAIWAIVHLVPAATPQLRAVLINKLGEKPYKGIFSLLIVGAIILIVLGWQNTVVAPEYQPPFWGRLAAVILMAPALLLFISGRKPNNIRRILRHPQLSGLFLICVAHLLANGDNRSVLLFLTLAFWAVMQMYYINRRDGQWQKPQTLPIKEDLISVVIAAIAYGLLLVLHPYITGINLL